jgi:TRAP-type C4-dicarboxylate transport system substrate-binding protein
MNRRMTTLLASAALAILAYAPAAMADTVLKVSNWLPPSHPIVKDMLTPWGKQIEEATKGRVKIEILPSPLGPPPAQFDIAKDGLADVAFSVHGYTPGRFTLTEIAELPFLSDKAEALSVAYWRVTDQMLAKADEHKGVKLLSVFTHGPGHIFNTKKPIKNLDDLKGMKMRVGGGIVNTIAKELDFVPVMQPSSKAYEILSAGVADGILFPHESVPFFKLEKVLKNGTLVPRGLYNTSFFLIMNQAKWDGLAAEDKAAITAASGEAFARLSGKAWDAADKAGLDAMKAAGIQFETMSPGFMTTVANKLSGLEMDWYGKAKAKGVDGEAALKMLRAEIGKEMK